MISKILLALLDSSPTPSCVIVSAVLFSSGPLLSLPDTAALLPLVGGSSWLLLVGPLAELTLDFVDYM